MGLLQPEAGLLFWMVVSFAIVLFILAKFGFPIILKSVNKRKDFIDSSLAAAKEADERLAKVQARTNELLAKAESDRSEIIKEANLTREKMLQQATLEAAAERKRLIEQARERAETERQTILSGARKEVASISVEVTERLLRKQLEDIPSQEALIGRIFDEIEAAEEKK